MPSGYEPISAGQFARLRAEVLDPCKIKLAPEELRRAAERLAYMLGYFTNECARTWTVSNTSPPPGAAHRPRNVKLRQLFGSLSGFWSDYIGWPGVSFNGEHYGGPFARFALAMCAVLLSDLRRQKATRESPFVDSLSRVCDKPAEVRKWLRQIRITQLGTNFERFLRGEVFLTKELPGWQFEVDQPRESCYQIEAIDPKGQSRFIEQGLNLKAVRKAAVSRALRLTRRKQTKAPKARSRTKK
jgi:hypothetical protein